MCFSRKPTQEGASRPLPSPQPNCPLCNGRGYIYYPIVTDFGEGSEVQECPKCHPWKPNPMEAVWFWLVAVVVALGVLTISFWR